MYMGHNGENRVYVRVLKGRRVSLQKHAYLGCTIDHTFRSLFTLVFISTGHYPYYGIHDFHIIKSFSAKVIPPGFFQGYLPKNIGVCVCMIWFEGDLRRSITSRKKLKDWF
jgi:hypothetical protein